MRLLLSLLLLGGYLMGVSQNNLAGGDLWNGTFSGDINGTASTLELQNDNNQISGAINAGGYLYKLNGRLNGVLSQGQLTDPQTQGIMSYEGRQENSTIYLSLNANGSIIQLQFTKSGQTGGPLQSLSNGATSANQLDQSMLGHWIYSDSYTSGEFSFASQFRLILKPDGTYLYGDGQVAGGGPGVSGNSGSGGMEQGKWKTENRIVYINEGNGWQPYAKYYVEGNSMMFTFNDGSKQIWKKTQ